MVKKLVTAGPKFMELQSWFQSYPSNFGIVGEAANTHPASSLTVKGGPERKEYLWGSQLSTVTAVRNWEVPENGSQVTWVLILPPPSEWLFSLNKSLPHSGPWFSHLQIKGAGWDDLSSPFHSDWKCKYDSEFSKSSQERWWGEVTAPTKSI